MKKETRRVKMTKKLLSDSLIHFLSQKEIHKITVKEICDYADINRSTFYRYYQDPMDQLYKMQQDVIVELNSYVEQIINKINYHAGNNSHENLPPIEEYLEYIHSKRDLIQLLMKTLPNNQFITNFIGQAQQQLTDSVHALHTATNNYDFIFASSGCIGLIVHWITEEPCLSTHTVAQLMSSYLDAFYANKSKDH